jgi:hypothetical protein
MKLLLTEFSGSKGLQQKAKAVLPYFVGVKHLSVFRDRQVSWERALFFCLA